MSVPVDPPEQKRAGERFLETLETHDPPFSEPVSEQPVQSETGAGSPSAVRQHEIEMTLLLTKINQELPDALSALQRAKDKVRSLRLEKAGAERLLATHRRLRNPVRRKVAK